VEKPDRTVIAAKKLPEQSGTCSSVQQTIKPDSPRLCFQNQTAAQRGGCGLEKGAREQSKRIPPKGRDS